MLPSSGLLAGAAHLFFSPISRWQQTFQPRSSQKLKLTGLTVLSSVLRDHIRRRRWEWSLTWGANGALNFCTASLSVYKKESGQTCRMGFSARTQSLSHLIYLFITNKGNYDGGNVFSGHRTNGQTKNNNKASSSLVCLSFIFRQSLTV